MFGWQVPSSSPTVGGLLGEGDEGADVELWIVYSCCRIRASFLINWYSWDGMLGLQIIFRALWGDSSKLFWLRTAFLMTWATTPKAPAPTILTKSYLSPKYTPSSSLSIKVSKLTSARNPNKAWSRSTSSGDGPARPPEPFSWFHCSSVPPSTLYYRRAVAPSPSDYVPSSVSPLLLSSCIFILIG